MTLVQASILVALAGFSIVDLRTRLVPFIGLFFALAMFAGLLENQLHVIVMLLAILWGLLRRTPAPFMLPFLFYPPSWPVLLVGFGVRKRIVGRGDLLALGIVGFLFPFPALIMSLLGFEIWRRWWMKRGHGGLVPAIPGLFLGLASYSLIQISWSHLLLI